MLSWIVCVCGFKIEFLDYYFFKKNLVISHLKLTHFVLRQKLTLIIFFAFFLLRQYLVFLNA